MFLAWDFSISKLGQTLSMVTKTDSILSANLEQSQLLVKHHQQTAYLVRWSVLPLILLSGLQSWIPSDLVCSLTLTIDEQKARFNSIENKTPKKVEARTQPCFTLLLTLNYSETLSTYWTVAFVLVWKYFTILRRFGWQPSLNSIAKKSFFTY